MRSWKTPGVAVAVVLGDEEYIRGYGVKEVGTEDPITPNTLFALASMTKAFTTAAMAILVDEGKMAWDDHPRKHLPYFKLSDPHADALVTMRDLVSHRTGMPRHDALWSVEARTADEIVRRYGLAPHSTSFRSTYEYANVPFSAAGLAVGTVAGGTWQEFLKKRIFKPLKMTAVCKVSEAEASADHSHGHVPYKGKIVLVPTPKHDNSTAAGAINASATDMSKWIRLHLNDGEFGGKQIISKANLDETKKPHIVIPVECPDKYGFDGGVHLSTYCMGWGKDEYRGEIIIGHGGWLRGFTGNTVLIPRLKAGITVLTNLAVGGEAISIRNLLLDLLLGLPRRNWPADFKRQNAAIKKEAQELKAKESRHKRTKPSHALDAYVGEYEDPAYGTLTVSMPDGVLRIEHGEMKYNLKHYHFNVFSGKHDQPEFWEAIKVQFTIGADGEVASIKTIATEFNAEFKKVKKEQS
jgi:CubicO group peptidase (beta-lactamase class C family)